MRSGEGPFIEDVNGNRYVDWVLSWGPLLFGHADPDHAGGGGRGARPRHDVRGADRGRGRPGRRDRRRGALDRDGAARLVGHRGGDEHRPARARGDAPRPADQVRRQLPRPRRRPARERRLGADDARDPVDAGRSDGRRRRHDRAALQRRRRRRGRRRRSTARGSPRSSSSRSPATWASSRRRPASSRRCGCSATRAARCSSSTR